MCFDIDVNKLSMEELKDTLRRISMLLSKPTVVNNLPDKGHQLRQAKAKLENEIQFRENLEITRQKMKNLSLRCASEANIPPTHSFKICSMEKKPERERFKPHLTLKPSSSGKTKSMKELHSGTKLIDLTTSLSLQMQQAEREKSEQVRAKQERLLAYMRAKNDNSDDSESEEFNLSDYSAEEEDKSELDDFGSSGDEPGPSQRKVKEPKKAANELKRKFESNTDLETEAVKLKKEPEEPDEEFQPPSGTAKIKTEVMDQECKAEKIENEIQSTNDSAELKEEVLESKEEANMA